ncbi:MAG TPA: glycosyltransferase family 9 protein [Gemmatimonadaceae bacterium]|jgi:ADP-heptose:LPS heptosyltransferase|nr:glycosyltransferase family 9 protein [Gemmatimonadaceae bacterium]
MRLKALELWWRRLWIRLLVRLMRQPAGKGAPDWAARPHRVLFLRHDRAGDMILSTGVMRAIARSHSTITMDVLASPANAAILEAADYVADVIVFDKKKLATYLPTALRLRRNRYDAVIDCMVTAPSLTTLLLVAASGARHRVGIAGRGNDDAFSVTVPPETRAGAHMVDLLAALAPAFAVNASAVEKQPVISLTAEERQRAERSWGDGHRSRILINISAGTSARAWPPENYVAVMEHLRAREPRAVFRVISAPAEAEKGELVAEGGGGVFVRTPGIRDAFALVATAGFVFTPDTSIAHAASAFHIPCVAMYLRGTSERWGLYGTRGLSVEHPNSTLDDLPVATMLRAVDQVLDDRVEQPHLGDAALREPR